MKHTSPSGLLRCTDGKAAFTILQLRNNESQDKTLFVENINLVWVGGPGKLSVQCGAVHRSPDLQGRILLLSTMMVCLT